MVAVAEAAPEPARAMRSSIVAGSAKLVIPANSVQNDVEEVAWMLAIDVGE